MINVQNLPPDITESARGVLWNRDVRDGKATKVPYQAHHPGLKAAVDDPATWAPFQDARAAYEDGKADGVGFVLGDGVVGVDLDGCRDPQTGAIDGGAQSIIDALASYTEISPSGTGVHILLRGSLPRGGRRKGKIEMYCDGRYFTVTGQHLDGTPTTIAERTTELASLHGRLFKTNGNGHRSAPPDVASVRDDDQALLDRARRASNGHKFSGLWNGDTSRYASASEADQALATLLAFWSGADAARIDRLFRQSGLMREKWDERRGKATYGDITIATAIAGCVDVYTGARPAPVTVSDPTPEPAPASYVFAPAAPEDHFVGRWIAYTSGRTDAAHEYHEAAGLVLLAAATPRLRARLAPYPNGLATNLYVLLLGDSTTSRKSTTKDFARDVQDRALPGSQSADHFSPEGFVEQLASRPKNSTTLYVDEFGELLNKLHHAKHMAGLRGLFLTVYSGDDYTYRRHSKRTRDGAKVADEDRIEQPHLSILGATTPAVFDLLTEPDVICGLLPRFAIIMPTGKPTRRPFFEVGDDTESQRTTLVAWLHRLHAWATETPRVVRFAPGVLNQLDGFAAALEQGAAPGMETAKAMLQRLTPMTIKLAMLVAAGRPETPDRHCLEVTSADAEAAIQVANRWQAYAVAFASRIGESDFERRLQRCLRIVRSKGRVSRSLIARQAHVDRKMLDNIRDTMVDRGNIIVELVRAGSGPVAEFWRYGTEGEELL